MSASEQLNPEHEKMLDSFREDIILLCEKYPKLHILASVKIEGTNRAANCGNYCLRCALAAILEFCITRNVQHNGEHDSFEIDLGKVH